jgi:hypothetical protein
MTARCAITARSVRVRAVSKALAAFGMLVVVSLLSASSTSTAAAQDPSAGVTPWTAARTSDGQPDLQGFWTATVAGTYDLTDPRGGEIRLEEVALATRGIVRKPNPSRIIDPPDGKIPYQPWAAAKHSELQAHADNPTRPEHIDTQNRCLPDGPLRDLLHGGFRIVQVPGYFILLGEENYGYRAVPLDGRPHLGQDLTLWMGDPRGHWEGNTLVVESTNYNDKGMIATSAATQRIRGIPQTDALHVVERFTPVDANTIMYRATVDDKNVYTKPWTVEIPLTRDPKYVIFEYSCEEGNYATPNILAGGRKAERDAANTKN